MQLMGQGFNDDVIKRRYLEALNIPDSEELMPKEGQGPPPDPKVVLEQQKLEFEREKFDLEVLKAEYEIKRGGIDEHAGHQH